MAAFVFRLAPLLDLRERVEAEKRRGFAGARHARDRNGSELEELAVRRSACMRALHGCASRPAERGLHEAHLQFLTRNIAGREAAHPALAQAVREASGELAIAHRERRAIALLKERRLREYELEAQMREEREIEEANARRVERRPT